MIFRQFYHAASGAFSYLVAERPGGEAFLVDPAGSSVATYLDLLRQLDLNLTCCFETHSHGLGMTAASAMREYTGCATIMGERSRVDGVSEFVSEGERVTVGALSVFALYTPGHTEDSYSFVLEDRVFTGDTLLIRSTGRTDLDGGDAAAQYDSIFNKLLRLPETMLVFPGHDYRGWTTSTIDEERWHNPRLQVESESEYRQQMEALRYEDEDIMDAVEREPVMRFL